MGRCSVWSGEAGQIADGKVDDATGLVTEAWTGPQVAWKMARGGAGAFGGREINRPAVWLGLCAVFLLGLADWRRPLSLRNLDLLALLSFSISLWFFNRGEIFWSVPLAYPPLVWLLARMRWIGARRGRVRAVARPLWPVWVLARGRRSSSPASASGSTSRRSNVIDVGYAGVIGADRIVDGEAPYGNLPVQGDLKPCGPADADGEIRERIQTNGRCESANERGDTYGPVSYLAYVPGYLALRLDAGSGTTCRPRTHVDRVRPALPARARARRAGASAGSGSRRRSPFAWAAYPFTQYASSSNTNDAILPAFLIWGFWLRGVAGGRAAAFARARRAGRSSRR